MMTHQLLGVSVRCFVAAFGASIVAAAAPPSTKPAPPDIGKELDGGLKVSIHVAAKEVETGAPVDVTVTLENVSQQVVQFVQTAPVFDARFVVLDEKGNEMPLTRGGVRLQQIRGAGGRRERVRLKPGETMEFVVRANWLYDLSAPDKYTLTAVTDVDRGFDENRWIRSRSNTITIEVMLPN